MIFFWPRRTTRRRRLGAIGWGRREEMVRTNEAQGMGSAGIGSGAGSGDEPLRRQHLLRRARALGRLDADHRRRHRHPQPRRRHRPAAAEDQHPAHPPPPRPHPGADVLRPLLPLRDRDHDLGPVLARGLARGADRPLHLGPALARSRSASFPATSTSATPRRASGSSGRATIRAEAVTHRGPTLGYRITDGDTTLTYISDHEPGAGRAAREPRARVDLRLRPRPRTPTC